MCVCALGVSVRANASIPQRAHAGVHTGTPERRLCNRACVFRPFLLTVESQQLPGGACVCCSVMKAFLISGLGCSLHASQLETAEVNTCCPVPRSRAGTKLAHRSLAGLLLAAADTGTLKWVFYYFQLIQQNDSITLTFLQSGAPWRCHVTEGKQLKEMMMLRTFFRKKKNTSK